MFEGEPCRVVEFRHHTPGNLRAMIQTKLRSLRTGSSLNIASARPTLSIAPRLNSTKWSISIRMDPITIS